MISLPKITASDSDTSIFGQSAKGADGAQDFLALLAGALGGNGLQGDKALTLADLQAAKARLQKGLPDLAAGQDGKLALDPKLSALLAAQQDTLTDADLTKLTGEQALLTGLTPTVSTDALSALTKNVQRGADLSTDSDTDLSEEELASLSALLAMLPPQQTTASAPVATATSSLSALNAAAGVAAKAGLEVNAATLATGKGKDSAATVKANDAAAFATSAQQLAGASVNTVKSDSETAPVPTLPTIAAAPTATTHITTAAPATPVAPLVNAQLGSQEWQQSVSQHITMFTRQGQQTAELRLHPEDLGQVQITLKLDDNQAQLQMVSAHSHVRAALEAALPVLRTHLAESGIQLGQSSISSESFAGQQQSSSQQQAQRSGTSGNGQFGAEEDETLNVPASLQSVARGNGAVDIFA